MDQKNFFETRTTFGLLRLEYFAGLVVSLALTWIHLAEIRWWAFALLFIYIDAIGYLPGAIAFRRKKQERIAPVYHVLYNCTHSLLSGVAVVILWTVFVRPEWALLAVPVHLMGDRSLFGNFLKPFGVSFEPKEHPAFARFCAAFEDSQHGKGQRDVGQ